MTAACLFLAAALLAAPATQAQEEYLHELQASARQQHLAEAIGWLKLLHYEKGLFGGFRSDASAAFFVSPRGAGDPQAELDADLAGFFSAAPAREGEQVPQCQFPARLGWLNGRLHFDFARMPLQPCPAFEEFYQRVAARGVTAIFSSYFLSSPASAFGHTLLRLDKTDEPMDEKHFQLLDYGVNYAASVDTQNAFVYAVKGLVGLFPGRFNSIPYYYKVREYNDFESRDLWEYDLSLTPAQVAMLVAHVWELGSTQFPYYYVSRNCSYHLIAALEAAVPELDLLSHVGHVAVPADTIKVLHEMPGLVRTVRYRPSVRAQFRRRAQDLSGRQLDEVEKLADAPQTALPGQPAEQASVLDAALDLVDLRHARGIILGTDAEALAVKQRLLERRSEVRVQSEALTPDVPSLQAPDRGHGSMRVGAGGGGSTETGGFGTLEVRLALHDLLDPPAGYPELAQLEFLPVRLRYNFRDRTLWLAEAWLADVASLAPMDRFDKPLSWRMRAGAATLRDSACAGCLAGVLDIAGGGTIAFGGERLTFFAMADSEVVSTPQLKGLSGAPVRIGVGPLGGARLRLGESLVLAGDARWQYLPWAAPRTLFELEFSARLALAKGTALNAQITRRPTATEVSLGAFYYF